jgi:putative nucleotidyltransferase with HDIG domain
VPAQGRDEIGVLAESFNHMLDSLNESKQELLDAYEKTIEGWARATDLRDHETEGHSRRVAELTVALARKMGIGEEALVDIRRGALLHDIGKIAVPDSILLKAGRLTNEQLAIMRKHPERAREFIQQIGFLKPALTIPYCHHERWDGTGYPRGLKGTQIPLEARIFAVVDVWDALISDRPYREAMAPESAMAYIVEQSGRHFDPSVVAAFQKLMSR